FRPLDLREELFLAAMWPPRFGCGRTSSVPSTIAGRGGTGDDGGPGAGVARTGDAALPPTVELAMRIVEGGLEDPRVVALLHTHLARARAETAPGSAHALDLSGLRAPGVVFWSAWEGDAVVGVGALRRLSADHGEIKSMHTAEAARGRGVGSAMLRHIMAAARARGMSRLSLETGSWPY